MHPQNKHDRFEKGKKRGLKRVSTWTKPHQLSDVEIQEWRAKHAAHHRDSTKLCRKELQKPA